MTGQSLLRGGVILAKKKKKRQKAYVTIMPTHTHILRMQVHSHSAGFR